MKTAAFIFYFLLSAVNLGFAPEPNEQTEPIQHKISVLEILDHGFISFAEVTQELRKSVENIPDLNPLGVIDVMSSLEVKKPLYSLGLITSDFAPVISDMLLKYTHFLRIPFPSH